VRSSETSAASQLPHGASTQNRHTLVTGYSSAVDITPDLCFRVMSQAQSVLRRVVIVSDSLLTGPHLQHSHSITQSAVAGFCSICLQQEKLVSHECLALNMQLDTAILSR
jgi:hypothetical protein